MKGRQSGCVAKRRQNVCTVRGRGRAAGDEPGEPVDRGDGGEVDEGKEVRRRT